MSRRDRIEDDESEEAEEAEEAADDDATDDPSESDDDTHLPHTKFSYMQYPTAESVKSLVIHSPLRRVDDNGDLLTTNSLLHYMQVCSRYRSDRLTQAPMNRQVPCTTFLRFVNELYPLFHNCDMKMQAWANFMRNMRFRRLTDAVQIRREFNDTSYFNHFYDLIKVYCRWLSHANAQRLLDSAFAPVPPRLLGVQAIRDRYEKALEDVNELQLLYESFPGLWTANMTEGQYGLVAPTADVTFPIACVWPHSSDTLLVTKQLSQRLPLDNEDVGHEWYKVMTTRYNDTVKPRGLHGSSLIISITIAYVTSIARHVVETQGTMTPKQFKQMLHMVLDLVGHRDHQHQNMQRVIAFRQASVPQWRDNTMATEQPDGALPDPIAMGAEADDDNDMP